jgi:antirestriction protein ArdC
MFGGTRERQSLPKNLRRGDGVLEDSLPTGQTLTRLSKACAVGSRVYSREELVAELSAAYLCAEAGISSAVISNQTAYVAGWLKKLRDDRKLLILAAAQAQRAADYILGRRCGE